MKITVISQLKACAKAARGFVGELAAAAVDAIAELESAKADKPQKVSVTIPITGWGMDSGDYPKYYDIAVDGVTVNDRARVYIAPDSQKTASACGMCSTNETLAGKVRIRAREVPAAAIQAECEIEKGG